jgi:miniconductance mechanosensitive channel
LLLLSGIGAVTAVLLLIFRDTILSFVASLQITSYDMIRVGDWIEMSQYGADGDVIELTLHTVKVQNWDKTITAIPTHKLIEQPFRNWRGMQESGGRRIKRSFYVDMSSIRFLTDEELDRLENFAVLRDYIREKRAALAEFNAAFSDPALIPNARRLTNIGTFRAYLVQYLRRHPQIHQDMTLLVRQLAPGAGGLPIELYTFTNTTNWNAYEDIQSDIFDHILSIIREFGLRVFQDPSGMDFARLGKERDAPSLG